jgi:hypothetical protein
MQLAEGKVDLGAIPPPVAAKAMKKQPRKKANAAG